MQDKFLKLKCLETPDRNIKYISIELICKLIISAGAISNQYVKQYYMCVLHKMNLINMTEGRVVKVNVAHTNPF